MAEIDKEQVLRIAELAHLELSDAELARMTAELGSILGYVRQLEEVDVEGVPPTAHAPGARGVPAVRVEALGLREDTPGASLPREDVLAQAPRARDGAFVVPAFVDEEK